MAAVAGCQRGEPAGAMEYRTVAADPRRDTDTARHRNGEAAVLIEAGELDAAEAKLKDAIAAAKKSGRNPAAVKAAEEYLKKVFAIFNGDQKDRWSLQPYLGSASSWGCESFYDAWQERMAWHAAAVKGVPWVD